jgi:cyclophilin family peptidyl-prolyl cis-trans isomerase
MRIAVTCCLAALLAGCAAPEPGTTAPPASPIRPMAELLKDSPASDWRRLDSENVLYMDLPAGRVVIELAPTFAPAHVANIRTLVRQGYFDGLAIVRAQDNYVAQWGDPDEKREFGAAKKSLAPEFTRALTPDLAFTALPDRDTYAETGFSSGFPAARDPASARAWLVHCYAMVGAGRANEADSGSGAELYAVIGNAPRLLDRNATLVGRVVRGIELLSTLPRGTGALGFYEKAEQRTPIRAARMASDLPAAERVPLEALRTDSETFRQLVEGRRFRRDDWYKEPAGHVDVCNVTLPIRNAAPRSPPAWPSRKPRTTRSRRRSRSRPTGSWSRAIARASAGSRWLTRSRAARW